jgi:hypothetical protein
LEGLEVLDERGKFMTNLSCALNLLIQTVNGGFFGSLRRQRRIFGSLRRQTGPFGCFSRQKRSEERFEEA